MNDVGMWIIIAVLAVIILGYVIYKAVVIFKMSPEDRKRLLVTYLMGLVSLAEQLLGSGHGAEKLALVEELFKKKAPFIYRVSLMIFGKNNLKELIELALTEVKNNFGK